MYTSQSHRYYSHVSHDHSSYNLQNHDHSSYNLQNHDHYTDIPPQNHEYPPQFDSDRQKNTNIVQTFSERDGENIITNMNTLSVEPKVIDAKFLEELEKRIGKKEDDRSSKNLVNTEDNFLLALDPVSNIVPTLKPPPQVNKVKNTNITALPCKVQNTWPSKSVNLEQEKLQSPQEQESNSYGEERLYDNILRNQIYTQESDTMTVVNKIWYERAMKENINSRKQSNVNGYVDTGWSENIKQPVYGQLQNTPVVIKSEYGEFKCNQRSTPDYSEYNSLPRPSSSYNSSPLARPNSQLDVRQNHIDVRQNLATTFNQYGNPVQVLPEYGQVQRHYNEVENVYSEVNEHIYNQPAQEVLRPHRPAPPQPMMGYPQSMQQLQRKLGHTPQTQVNIVTICNR